MAIVSIHIVTYNSAASIQACLTSIKTQTFSAYQVIVFDNNSTDETRRLVREAGVTLIESGDNMGYAAAHNRLIDTTESLYVLTLNPDVALMPDFVAEMVRALQADPKIGSAAGYLMRVETLGEPPQVIDSTGLAMRRSRRQRLLGENAAIDEQPLQNRPIFGPDGAAAFYRRAMLNDIRVEGEVFDDEFFMHKEDVDVCWRAQLRGWGALFVPKAVAHHIRSFRPGRRERVSEQMRFLGVRNRYLLMIKNEHRLHFMRDLPAILLYDLRIFIYIVLFERASLNAYASVWVLRRRMLQKRAVIQSQRRVSWQSMARWFTA